MTVEIPLTQGQVAIVCDCHAHLVQGYKWNAKFSPHTKSFYAYRGTNKGKVSKSIPMHRVINNTPDGYDTDHENHNTLDNRCSNLRTATRFDNQRNRGKNHNNTSGYKGVVWREKRHHWRSMVSVNGKQLDVGTSKTAEEAARKCDIASLKYHGDFAILNFPKENYL